MASRTTATFFARSALSTTRRRRAEHTGHAPLFDRLEVEVLQDGACLPLDKRGVVALDQEATVAERAVTDGWRGLVQQDQIDGPPRRRLQPGGEPAEGVHVARRALAEFDCHVDVAARVQRAAHGRAEYERVGNVAVCLEDATEVIQHDAILPR